MHLGNVMDDLGNACELVPGLRAFPYTADKVIPPAAIVSWPDTYDFDSAMGRGTDHIQFPILVLVGRVDARTSRDRLASYIGGSGASTLKQTIESYTATSYGTARVVSVKFGTATIGGVSYLAATFTIDIYGPGKD